MFGPQQASRAMRIARRGRFGRFGCCHGGPPDYPGPWLAAGPRAEPAGRRAGLARCIVRLLAGRGGHPPVQVPAACHLACDAPGCGGPGRASSMVAAVS
jgi:hypothetical protein